jgi:hypothetical protein
MIWAVPDNESDLLPDYKSKFADSTPLTAGLRLSIEDDAFQCASTQALAGLDPVRAHKCQPV